jgi:predicted ATP-grasp superfamily ATP-dependent carboligase
MRVFVYEHVSAGGLRADEPESLRREGQAMLDAVCADFRIVPAVEVVTVSAPGRFRETAACSDWTLVIAPESGDQLCRLSQAVLDAGGRLLGSRPDAIALTGDKLATAQYWRTRGVAHPRTELIDMGEPARFGPPWVIKPRHGAGSQATFVVDRSDAWEPAKLAAQREWPGGDLIWQPHVAGRAASVALLVGDGHTLPLLPAWQHLSSDGRLRYEGGALPVPMPYAGRAVRVAVEAVAGIAGLRGYVGVDLVLGDDGDCAIEINPRLTTSYIGLRQLCQGNLAALMLQCARGEKMEPLQWEPREVSFGTGHQSSSS